MDIFTRTPPDGDEKWAVIRDESAGRFVVAIFFDRDEAAQFVASTRGQELGAFLSPVVLET